MPRVHHCGTSAGAACLGKKRVTVEALAAQRDEQIAGVKRPFSDVAVATEAQSLRAGATGAVA